MNGVNATMLFRRRLESAVSISSIMQAWYGFTGQVRFVASFNLLLSIGVIVS